MQSLRVGPIFRSSKSDCGRLGDAAYTDLTESVSDRAGAATKDCTRRRARSTHLPSPGCPITFLDNHHARLNERFRENCPSSTLKLRQLQTAGSSTRRVVIPLACELIPIKFPRRFSAANDPELTPAEAAVTYVKARQSSGMYSAIENW